MFRNRDSRKAGEKSGPRLGYRMINPHDPPEVPRRFEPIDPEFQRRAERLFEATRNAPYPSQPPV